MLLGVRWMHRQLDGKLSSSSRSAFHLEAPAHMLDALTHTH
jgi:hypothetical protein